MNTKLRTEAKNDFEKGFFKLMNNVFLNRALRIKFIRKLFFKKIIT